MTLREFFEAPVEVRTVFRKEDGKLRRLQIRAGGREAPRSHFVLVDGEEGNDDERH